MYMSNYSMFSSAHVHALMPVCANAHHFGSPVRELIRSQPKTAIPSILRREPTTGFRTYLNPGNSLSMKSLDLCGGLQLLCAVRWQNAFNVYNMYVGDTGREKYE